MSLLSIMQPEPASVVPDQSSAGSGLANLLTPSPREAFAAAAAGAATITIDLGSAKPVDTFLLGFTNATAADTVAIQAGGGLPQVFAGNFAHSYRRAPLRHAVARLAAPVQTRFVRFTATTAVPLVAGVVAAGLSIVPASGYEWGSGRPIYDTGRAERLLGGGFGIQPGAVAGGVQWSMIALTDEERDRLYALSLEVGGWNTVLVVEDPDATPALNERVHWGLLTKLEPFERQQPGESKWTMSVQDWT